MNLHERLQRFRHRRQLARDDPGAPPGYLYDADDHRSPATCAGEVRVDRWDPDGDPLARGYGEDDL